MKYQEHIKKEARPPVPHKIMRGTRHWHYDAIVLMVAKRGNPIQISMVCFQLRPLAQESHSSGPPDMSQIICLESDLSVKDDMHVHAMPS